MRSPLDVFSNLKEDTKHFIVYIGMIFQENGTLDHNPFPKHTDANELWQDACGYSRKDTSTADALTQLGNLHGFFLEEEEDVPPEKKEGTEE